MELSNDGVFICQRIARDFGLKVGDNVEFSPYGTNNVYTAKIVPEQYSGIRCEHETDYSQRMSGQTKYYAAAPAQKRLNEPVEIILLVDSCTALSNETDKLLEEFFSKSVFE